MAVGLPEGPSYPGHSPSFFRYAAPWTTVIGQHTASLKLVACFLFFFPPALLRFLNLLLLLMSGNVHPNPGPIFSCSVCAGNVTWRGKSVQCCTYSKWVHLRCSQLSLFKFRALGSSHSWSCPPAVTLWLPPPTCIPSLYNLVSSANATLSPTLVSKPLIPHLPILLFIPLPPHHRPLLLAVLLRLLPPLPPPDSLRVLEWNAGGLRARSTELLHFLSSHPVDHICIQKSNLNSSSSFRIPGFSALRSDCTHSRSGILSRDATNAGGGVVIFIRQGLSFSELSISSLSSLDPYSDYVGINISLNNAYLLSFLNVYALLFAPLRRMAEPTPSLPPFFLPEISSFWGTSIAITPSATQEVLPNPAGRKYSTESSPLTYSPSMTLTHPLFSIAPLAVAPLLTSPLFLLLLPFLAPGRCFRTWVLTTYQTFYPSLSLFGLSPQRASPFLQLSESSLGWLCLLLWLSLSFCRGILVSSLSSAAALFTSLALNAAKSSISFGRIKRTPKAWWYAEVEDAIIERRKAFAAAHRSDEDHQAYISASRRASSVKAKAEALQTTCSSLSSKSNPKSEHSFLRSIAGSPSSSSSFPYFPNCSSSRESALVFAAYLRSHFSVSQPKALRSRARNYLSELRRAMCPMESHSSFCSPFAPAELLSATPNPSSSAATSLDKVAYPVLKHLPRSGMDFLLHIFNGPWTLHSFPSIWKTFSIISIHKMGKHLDSPASFRPISLTSFVSELFQRIILSRLLFFLETNAILFPCQAGFRPGRSTLDQILFLSQSISNGFNKPRPGSWTILSTIISLKLLTLSGIPPFSINLFRLAFLLALLVEHTLSFLVGALVWFIKITKAVPFESIEVFHKDPLLSLYFSLSSLMIFRPLCLLPSAALFTLTIWPLAIGHH